MFTGRTPRIAQQNIINWKNLPALPKKELIEAVLSSRAWENASRSEPRSQCVGFSKQLWQELTTEKKFPVGIANGKGHVYLEAKLDQPRDKRLIIDPSFGQVLLTRRKPFIGSYREIHDELRRHDPNPSFWSAYNDLNVKQNGKTLWHRNNRQLDLQFNLSNIMF